MNRAQSAHLSGSGDGIDVEPFRFDVRSSSQPASFEIAFIEGGAVYELGFAADTERVWEEWLYVRPPGGRLQRWFSRSLQLVPSESALKPRLARGERIVVGLGGDDQIVRSHVRSLPVRFATRIMRRLDAAHQVRDAGRSEVAGVSRMPAGRGGRVPRAVGRNTPNASMLVGGVPAGTVWTITPAKAGIRLRRLPGAKTPPASRRDGPDPSAPRRTAR